MVQNIEWIKKVLYTPEEYKSTDYNRDSCPIWKRPMKIKEYSEEYVLIDSPRAGGYYKIDEYTAKQLYALDNPDFQARLTSILVRNRLNGTSEPTVSISEIEEAQKSTPLEVGERVDRILCYFLQHSESLDHNIVVHPICRFIVDEYLIAWSESIQKSEMLDLLDDCCKHGWLDKKQFWFSLTVDGRKYLDNSNKKSTNSSQAFVAMWFDDEMNEAWAKGFRPGIEEAGYEAVRIDKKNYNDKIDDEIIAEIRRSRFVVADFTHGESGARGGVYYEAGFAHGLGIEVIFTCREDKSEEVHFDVRQYNQIVWKSVDELKSKLRNRIVATLGEGPKIVKYKD